MTGAEILDRAKTDERSRFSGTRVPRVSLMAHCDRRHVAQVLELIPSTIDPYYQEAGYMIQDRVYQRIKSVYPGAEQELTVRTTVENGDCHPDIFIPEISHAIQAKSCSKKFLAGSVSLKAGHKDQVMMEWHFWMLAGSADTEDECTISGCPTTYEVLYVSREDYGLNYKSIPIHYDPIRAGLLQKRYEDLAVMIDLEILPPAPVGKTQYCRECAMNCFEE